MDTFYRFFKRFERVAGTSFYSLSFPATRADSDKLPSPVSGEGQGVRAELPLLHIVTELRNRFLEAMDDDFNTGGGIGALFDLVRVLNKFVDDEKLEEPAKQTPGKIDVLRRGTIVLRELAATLGLFRIPREEKPAADDDLTAKLMSLLIDLRAEARKKKDFATADRIRNTLTEIGITLEDRPGGTDWSRK
jgi:cysteinyl-tRNA synthetase